MAVNASGLGTDASTAGAKVNPKLFEYDPAKAYRWQAFDRITVAVTTWNRLEFSKPFFSSILKYSHLPYRLLVLDNGSTDGTVEYVQELARQAPNITLVANPKNVGKIRALLQIRDMVDDGLLVSCDNDIEFLTNYWQVLLLKAFHAVRLSRGNADVALSARLVNQEEYGFRYAAGRQVFRIPTAENDEPRSSYAAASKDDPDPSRRLDEEVVIGWTQHIVGCFMALPAKVFKQTKLEDAYPAFIGGSDSFVCAELKRLGVPMGYIDNGPIVRHNDWPYTDEKIRLYQQTVGVRAVSDASYLKWKLRRLLGRGR